MKSKSPTIETNYEDDFLYDQLTRLLEQIKLVQGATALNSTLRRHNAVTQYLISKQIERLRTIEETYFTEDGLLNLTAINTYCQKKMALQNHTNLVH